MNNIISIHVNEFYLTLKLKCFRIYKYSPRYFDEIEEVCASTTEANKLFSFSYEDKEIILVGTTIGAVSGRVSRKMECLSCNTKF